MGSGSAGVCDLHDDFEFLGHVPPFPAGAAAVKTLQTLVDVSAHTETGDSWIDLSATVTNFGDGCNPSGVVFDVFCDPIDLLLEGLVEEDETDPGGYVCAEDESTLVMLTLSAAGQIEQGTYSLTVTNSGEGRIKLYEDSGGMVEITPPLQGDVTDLPQDIWVKGDVPSSVLGDVELKLLYTGDGGPCEDRAKLTVVQVDLDMDSDNDNGTGSPDRSEGEDAIEMTPPGKLLFVNDDDDDGDGTPDKDQEPPPVADDDLVPMVVELTPSAPLDSRWQLVYDPTVVQVYESDRATIVPSGVLSSAPLSPNPDTFWIEGQAPVESATIDLNVDLEGDGVYDCSDSVLVTVIRVDLDGDADHDGTLADTGPDDDLEDELPGVLVLANVDDDDTPPGGIDNRDNQDSIVNAGTDKDDLTEILIHHIPNIPAGWTVTLTLHTPTNQESGVGPTGVVRLFADNAEGEVALVPDVGTGTYPPFSAIDLVRENGEFANFWVEGLKFAAEVKLKLEVKDPTLTLTREDQIQLKVAPFILLPNSAAPDRVLVADSDATFHSAITSLAGGSANVITTNVGDVWTQDAWEIGISSTPFQTSNVAFETIRADLPGSFLRLDGWGRTDLLGPTPSTDRTAFIKRLVDGIDAYSFGGNLEVTPPLSGDPLGRIVVGQQMDTEQKDFLARQGVQAPLIELHVGWLRVGHVDEVLNFIGSPAGIPGWEMVFASPELGFDILKNNVAAIPDYEPLFYGNPGDPLLKGQVTSGTATTLVDSTANFLTGPDWQYVRIYAGGAGQKGQIAKVTVTNATTLTVVRVWYLPHSNALHAALFGADPAPAAGQALNWYTTPDAACKYVLVPTVQEWWATYAFPSYPEFPALITAAEVRDDQTLELRNYLAANGIQPKIDTLEQVFQAIVPPNIPFRKVPAIYLGSAVLPNKKATAYVPGLVNMQVWGNSLWMPKPYGPRVLTVDQFELSADIPLKIGVRTTNYIDNWNTYHRLDGEVRCGTNVIRDAPSTPDD